MKNNIHSTDVHLEQNDELRHAVDKANGNIHFPKNQEKTSHSKPPFPGFGIFCAILCGFLFALNSLFAKLVTSLHPIQLGVSRCYIQFMILLPFVQYKHKSIDVTGPRGKKLYLCLRGFLGSSAMIFLYLSIEQLSLGNAVTISFLSTVLIPIIARIFLKESLTVLDCVFAVVSLCGVVLIAQPPFLFPNPNDEKRQSPIGVFYSLMCACLTSCTIIVIRKLGKETHFSLNVFYYSFMGSITTTTLLFALDEFRFPCSSHLVYMFSLGILGVLAQVFMTISLQWERASTVGILRTFQIILVYIMQVVLLNDIPSMISLLGVLLIFSSSVGIGIRRIINERNRLLRNK